MSKPATDAKAKKPGKPGKPGDPKKSAPPKPKGEGKKGAAEKARAAEAPEPSEPEPKVEPRLRVKYKTAVLPALMQRFGYKNVMQVPRLQKIVLNVGLGEATANPKMIDTAVVEVSAIEVSIIFGLAVASPSPTFRTIFCRRGTCITFL